MWMFLEKQVLNVQPLTIILLKILRAVKMYANRKNANKINEISQTGLLVSLGFIFIFLNTSISIEIPSMALQI